jgi:MFS family permease
MNSYITNTRGKWSVSRAITFISAIYNMGAIAGPFIGGQIANHTGIRSVYYLSAGIFIVSTVVLLFIRPQPVEKLPEGHDGKELFTNTRFLGFIGFFFFVIFSSYLSQPLTANFLQNQRGLDVGTIGTLGSIASLGIVILALGFGRLNPSLSFVLSQIASLLFGLFIWQGTGMPWYCAGYLFYGGMRVTKNLGIALTKPLVHPAQLGTAFGIMETTCSAALIAAPPIAGLIYQVNPSFVYPVSMVLIVIAMVLSLRKVPGGRRRGYPQDEKKPI